MSKLMMKPILILLFLSGCVDKGECLSSHKSMYMQPVYSTVCYANNGCSSQYLYSYPVETTECDKWEYPEGRPKYETSILAIGVAK